MVESSFSDAIHTTSQVVVFLNFHFLYKNDLNHQPGETVTHHTDLVKSIVSIESRVYTASFDRALIMYETSSYPSDKSLTLISEFQQAHAAAITCLTVSGQIFLVVCRILFRGMNNERDEDLFIIRCYIHPRKEY